MNLGAYSCLNSSHLGQGVPTQGEEVRLKELSLRTKALRPEQTRRLNQTSTRMYHNFTVR